MYYVYVLRSLVKENTFYTGYTENLAVRLSQHNAGKTKSTKHGAPWEIVYREVYHTRIEALNREKYLKSGAGREFLKSVF